MTRLTRSEAALITILLAVFLAPVVIGCREHHPVFRVEIPAGFSGAVEISCGSFAGDLQTVQVDATGRSMGASCTKDPVDLVVMRNGAVVQPDSVSWNPTGDGIPTHLSFRVK